MELTYATIVVLASMVFVLSAMVGYLYWQQTRMLQHIQSLAIVISTQMAPRQELEDEPEPEPEPEKEEEKPEEEEEEEDDRVSVKEEVEHVSAPPEDKVDVDDLQEKTAAQLREMLTKKGIPFGKRDAKPVLIQLLKATA
jgi:outer membrane biosynthesis protein TonB